MIALLVVDLLLFDLLLVIGFAFGDVFGLVCYNNVALALMVQGLLVFCELGLWFTLLWLFRFSV